jgi:endonuclease/exonuclease/phosphatase family metal-dependent hydrolase
VQNAESEVEQLPSFFSSIEGDFVLLGDLNICNPSILEGQQVKKDYLWILDDDDKTNSNLNCAYDRIVSPLDFNRFSHAKVMKDDNQAEKVSSDHFPLSIKISKRY